MLNAAGYEQPNRTDESKGLTASNSKLAVPHEIYQIIDELKPKKRKKNKQINLSRKTSTESMATLEGGLINGAIAPVLPAGEHRFFIASKQGIAYLLLTGRTLSCLYRFVTAHDAITLFSQLPWLNQWQSSPDISYFADGFAGLVTLCDMTRTIDSSKGTVIELCASENWIQGLIKFCQDVYAGELYPKSLLLSGFFAMLGTAIKGYKGSHTVAQDLSILEKIGMASYLLPAFIGFCSSVCFLAFNMLQISMWVVNTRKKLNGTRYRIMHIEPNDVQKALCAKGDDIVFEKKEDGKWFIHFGNDAGEYQKTEITNYLNIESLTEAKNNIAEGILKQFLNTLTCQLTKDNVVEIKDDANRSVLEKIAEVTCADFPQFKKNKEIRRINLDFVSDNKRLIFWINAMGLMLSTGGSLSSGISLFYEGREFEITAWKIALFIPIVVATAFTNYNFSLNPNYQLDVWMKKHHAEQENCNSCVITPDEAESETACWMPGARAKKTVGFFSSLGGAMTFSPGIIRSMQILIQLVGLLSTLHMAAEDKDVEQDKYRAIAQNQYVILGGAAFSLAFIFLSFLQDYSMWTAGASREKPKLQSPLRRTASQVSIESMITNP
ncbi:MAG: hypothetical protein NTZ67_03355 [Gammaproteobacteria bacterium]|nr:hypothetical protein [Gammaproteobacteria bacterium]